MPCDTIQTSKVEFLETSTDTDLLKRALEALGYTVYLRGNILTFSKYGRSGTFDKTTGKMTLASEWDGNEIKRAYSKEVVDDSANQEGWKISWSVNEQTGEDEAQIMKR